MAVLIRIPLYQQWRGFRGVRSKLVHSGRPGA